MAKNRTSRICRGYELIFYPSNLDMVINKEYKDYLCPDRRRKSYDRRLPVSCTIDFPNQDWDQDIPDDDTYYEIVNRIQDKCQFVKSKMEELFEFDWHFAFNLHDRDRGKDGKFLKNHFHIYFWTDDDLSGVVALDRLQRIIADTFNQYKVKNIKYEWDYALGKSELIEYPNACLTYTYITPIKSVCAALRYLIHIDNNDKELYLLEDCVSDVDLFKHKAFLEATKASQLAFLIDALDSGRVKSYKQLLHYAFDNGCIQCFMRNSWILTNYISSMCGKDSLQDHYNIPLSASPEDMEMLETYGTMASAISSIPNNNINKNIFDNLG